MTSTPMSNDEANQVAEAVTEHFGLDFKTVTELSMEAEGDDNITVRAELYLKMTQEELNTILDSIQKEKA